MKVRLSFAAQGFSASDGWALKLFLKGPVLPDSHSFLAGVDADADGDAFLVVLAAADTATLTSGTYAWVVRVSKSGEVLEPECDGRGSLFVAPNIAGADAGQFESHDEVMLAIVREKLQARVSKDVARMSEYTRVLEREAIKELRELEAYYLARINARLRGNAAPPSIRVAFVRP